MLNCNDAQTAHVLHMHQCNCRAIMCVNHYYSFFVLNRSLPWDPNRPHPRGAQRRPPSGSVENIKNLSLCVLLFHEKSRFYRLNRDFCEKTCQNRDFCFVWVPSTCGTKKEHRESLPGAPLDSHATTQPPHKFNLSTDLSPSPDITSEIDE
jgi:hypothetical protein